MCRTPIAPFSGATAPTPTDPHHKSAAGSQAARLPSPRAPQAPPRVVVHCRRSGRPAPIPANPRSRLWLWRCGRGLERIGAYADCRTKKEQTERVLIFYSAQTGSRRVTAPAAPSPQDMTVWRSLRLSGAGGFPPGGTAAYHRIADCPHKQQGTRYPGPRCIARQ